MLIPNIGSVICVRRYSVSPHLEILQMATQNDNLWLLYSLLDHTHKANTAEVLKFSVLESCDLW